MRWCGPLLGATAPGDLPQRDARGDARVEGLGRARDRDRDDRVAGLGHESGQPLALGADDDDDRPVRELELVELHVAVARETEHEEPHRLERLQGLGQVRRHRDGRAGGRAGGGLPCARSHADRAALRDDDAVPAERRRGPDDRTEVARVGDAVEGDHERDLVPTEGALGEVLRHGVLVRRDLEGDALVHAVVPRDAVELRPHDLHDRDAAVVGEREDLLDAVVHLDAGGDVEGRGGGLRAEGLEHRVAAGHELRVVGLPLRRATGALLRRARRAVTTTGGVEPLLGGLALAGGVVRAVLGLRRRLPALERLGALAAGADLLVALAAGADGAGPALPAPRDVLHA
ncbi:hypothetical protein Cus16_2912 [Curtobacterium sp. ER1/6]|nr:hypothetical protein Cus16_2912 [Curtobacterium sp. ER1/6]